jgi:hypothetical protein
MPVYITATALGKLGHPEGEVCLTRAAAKHDIIQMVSVATRESDQSHWLCGHSRTHDQGDSEL